MKIYTKTGDKGTTSLFGGSKVDKDHPLIQAYGTVDELNAILGVVHSEVSSEDLQDKVFRIQNELFELGADLATPWPDKQEAHVKRVGATYIERLEREIDEMEEQLTPLKSFILPGGSTSSAHLHWARTICRRAERSLTTPLKKGECNPSACVFLNRLSDWLFVLARFANKLTGKDDIPWKP